jgi:alpha-tubulin suppressor-like RCC1 family protein
MRSSVEPERVAGGPYESIHVGWLHTCAVDRDGQVFCFGQQEMGQLGLGAGMVLVCEPTLVCIPSP